MKLLIENFRKFLKEEEKRNFDPYENVVELYTKNIKPNDNADEIIEGMKEWIEDAIDDGGESRSEDKVLEVLKNKNFSVEEGDTLKSIIEDLIADAQYHARG